MTSSIIVTVSSNTICLHPSSHYLSRRLKRAMTRSAQQRAAINERRMMASMDYSAQSRRRYVNTARRLARVGELKVIDTSVTGSAASVDLVNACVQGTDQDERIGREILMTSIEIEGYVSFSFAAAGSDISNLFIVYDKQSNAAAPSFSDVYTTSLPNCVRNLDNRKRFKVLAEIPTMATTDVSNTVLVPVKYYRKLMLPVEFDASNAGDITDIRTGGLFVLQGSGPGGSTIGSTLKVRVRFSDK